MTEWSVRVQGCDASTVVTLDITPEQVETWKALAAAVTEASKAGSCKPSMRVQEGRPPTEDEYEADLDLYYEDLGPYPWPTPDCWWNDEEREDG